MVRYHVRLSSGYARVRQKAQRGANWRQSAAEGAQKCSFWASGLSAGLDFMRCFTEQDFVFHNLFDLVKPLCLGQEQK